MAVVGFHIYLPSRFPPSAPVDGGLIDAREMRITPAAYPAVVVIVHPARHRRCTRNAAAPTDRGTVARSEKQGLSRISHRYRNIAPGRNARTCAALLGRAHVPGDAAPHAATICRGVADGRRASPAVPVFELGPGSPPDRRPLRVGRNTASEIARGGAAMRLRTISALRTVRVCESQQSLIAKATCAAAAAGPRGFQD